MFKDRVPLSHHLGGAEWNSHLDFVWLPFVPCSTIEPHEIEQYWRRNEKETGNAIAQEACFLPEAPDELQIWLALYEVQQQNWEAVDRCLKRVNACDLLPFYQLLYQMVTEVAVSALSGGDYASSRAALVQIRSWGRAMSCLTG